MVGITGNEHILIIFGLVIITLLYAIWVIIMVLKRKIRTSNASREIALLKMDLLSKQAHLENLINDSAQWSHQDLKSYDRVQSDEKILKSKLDTGLILADTKVKRLELGNETAELFETLEKIKRYENNLFGESELNNGER